MKFLKSLLMGTGGVVLAGLVLALFAPKAVHAVVATAVQVVNTSANPAITQDASLQASQILTIRCLLNDVGDDCYQALPNRHNAGSPGPLGGFVVPANQSFVLKSIDYSTGSCQIRISIIDANNVGTQIESVSATGSGKASFSSGIVVGPGMEVVPYPAGLSAGSDEIATLHGYLTSN